MSAPRPPRVETLLEAGVEGQLYILTHPAGHTLTLYGSLDRYTGPILRNRLEPLIAARNPRITVNLDAAVLAETGVPVLAEMNELAQAAGTALALDGVTRHGRKRLADAGLAHLAPAGTPR